VGKSNQCERCHGTGQYRGVSKKNGRPIGGDCYRCQGKGWQDRDDVKRNRAYDRHQFEEAMRGMMAGVR
jgi:RecJ-like exonuclease